MQQKIPLLELVSRTLKKLVTVLATSPSTTVASKKAEPALSLKALTSIINAPPLLKCVPCIHYLVQLKKDQTNVWTLIDSDNKVNVITRFYTTKLVLKF